MKLSLYLGSTLCTVPQPSRTAEREERIIDRAIEYAKAHPSGIVARACLLAPCELRAWDAAAIAAVQSSRVSDLYR